MLVVDFAKILDNNLFNDFLEKSQDGNLIYYKTVEIESDRRKGIYKIYFFSIWYNNKYLLNRFF